MPLIRPTAAYTRTHHALALHARLLGAHARQVLAGLLREPVASLWGVLLVLFLLACALAYGWLALPLVREVAAAQPRITGAVLGLAALGAGLAAQSAAARAIGGWQARGMSALWPLTPTQQHRVRLAGSLPALLLPLLLLLPLPVLLPDPSLPAALLRGLVLSLLVLLSAIREGAGRAGRLLRFAPLAGVAWVGLGPLPSLPWELLPVLLLVPAAWFVLQSFTGDHVPAPLVRAVEEAVPATGHAVHPAGHPLARLARIGYRIRPVRALPDARLLAIPGVLGVLAGHGLPPGNAPLVQGAVALVLVLLVLNGAWERIHAGRGLLRLLPVATPWFLRAHLGLMGRPLALFSGALLLAALPGGTVSVLSVTAGVLAALALSLGGALLHLVSDGHKHRELLAALAWLLPSVASFWVFPPLAPVVLGVSTWRLWKRTRSVREHDAC